nr:hypothetical protein [Nannocystis sp.]
MKPRIVFPDTTQPPPASGIAASRPPLPALTIAAHPLLRRVGEHCRLVDLTEGLSVDLSRLGPDFRTCDGRLVGPIDEPHVSRTPLRLVPHGGGEVMLVPPDRKGAPVFVDGAPLRAPHACGQEALRRGVVIELSGARRRPAPHRRGHRRDAAEVRPRRRERRDPQGPRRDPAGRCAGERCADPRRVRHR